MVTHKYLKPFTKYDLKGIGKLDETPYGKDGSGNQGVSAHICGRHYGNGYSGCDVTSRENRLFTNETVRTCDYICLNLPTRMGRYHGIS